MNKTPKKSKRNPIAKFAWKFNKAKVIAPKKGKGSLYIRKKRVDE